MEKTTRRSFLAAVPAAAATVAAGDTSAVDPKALALDGGKPVRDTRLATAYPGLQFFDQREHAEVSEVLESRSLFRWYGPATPKKVATFEQEFARFTGARYALAVTSGTAALHCALVALGAGPGDEVILPAWTWYSCYNAIVLAGALPVFAEVDESLTLDPTDLEKKITPRTKAIMVVQLAGCPADMDPILAIARRHNVRVLEDAAQSVGARYKGKRLGAIGDIGIYSFQLSKTMTAGEGGAVVTSDPALFEQATRFHDLGMVRPGHQAVLGKSGIPWSFVGVNYRMNEMTGGVLCAQLRKLDGILDRCRESAHRVREQVGDLPGIRLRRLPDPDGEIGLYVHLLLKSKEQRDRFAAAMRAENVSASAPSGSLILPTVPYIEQKVAPHPQWPTFATPRGKAIRYGAACCPRSIDIFEHCAGVPIGPRYSASDVDDVVAAIRKVYRAVAG